MTKNSNHGIALNAQGLAALSEKVEIPRYDRQQVTQGIVHIGVGGFHRAHQAIYTEHLLQKHAVQDWAICGVGLLPQDKKMGEVLQKQDGLYTVVERHYGQENARIVGALTEYLLAPENAEAVLEKMASPEIKIVSLTITEGGYCYNEATEEFDASRPEVQHDLQSPQQPVGVFGFLTEALHRRRTRGLAPFTLLSCDNLQNNGALTQKMVLAFAQLRDPALHDWIAQNVTFPNSMVDRITPTTSDEDRQAILEYWGIRDEWPVVCEAFTQWVIEDDFCNGRPAWEKVGAQMTADVLPYEKMKIRLLNASHVTAAHLAYLDGYHYFHEAISDPLYVLYLERMMEEEITHLLPKVPDVDLTQYKKTLLERFANPSVKDHLNRLCMDGSSRMPKFVLPSIQEQLAQGKSPRLLTLGIAGWFRFLYAENEKGDSYSINDPMAEALIAKAKQGKTDPRPLLAMKEIFGEFLPQSEMFVNLLQQDLASLYQSGARATLQQALEP